ncbi:MAG: hypothetical protein HWN81_22065 [Candidatus Lokiarchaeota archaeon]|nr:hypothetical protein [Candidatus Lokiarchaeota archaeon]
MPHIVIFMKCPSHVVAKVVQKAMEARQKNLFPDDESIQENLVLSAWKTCEDGVQFLSVTLVKEGKLEEALKAIYKEMIYYSEIEGYELSIEVWGTMQEGFEALGMESPSD